MLLNKEEHKNHYIQSSKIYKYIAEQIGNILNKSELIYVKPDAAWYIFVNFENYKEELNAMNIYDGKDLSIFLLNKLHILTVPGESFNTSGLNLRFSFIDFTYNIDQTDDIDISNMLEGMHILVNYLDVLHH